jgi:hypothetical protein
VVELAGVVAGGVDERGEGLLVALELGQGRGLEQVQELPPGTVTGVALTAASLVLATLQQNLSGVYVRSAVPDIPASSFTVHLSKAVTTGAKVAWFVVN